MSSRYTFRFSRDFISDGVKQSYAKYLRENFGNTYNDIIDVINSTVQEVTMPGVNITHPTLRKFKKSSVHANEIMNRQLNISMRKIEGNINLYPIIEEGFLNYTSAGKQNLYIGNCFLECRSKRDLIIFELGFTDCVLVDVDLPTVDYREVEPSEDSISIVLEWNELKIKPLPYFK